MALTLERMRKRVRKMVGVEDDDPDLIDSDIDEYLNTSLWEITSKFHFREKEKTATFSTVEGVRNYDMPRPFEALQSLAVMSPDTSEFTKLIRMDPDVYENQYISLDSEQAIPTHYVREGCFARLWPTPNAAYTISIKRLITITDLTDPLVAPDIPQEWHEIILYGGYWRALLDYGDLARANQFKNHQISLINSTVPTAAKEENDSREAGLEVMGRNYDV